MQDIFVFLAQNTFGTEIYLLPTLSMRRATGRRTAPRSPADDFYPRSPCGERHITGRVPLQPFYFYPRSPCGERLYSASGSLRGCGISIHALHAESDRPGSLSGTDCEGFLSTLSMRRATPPSFKSTNLASLFLSTLSMRRATSMSIHSRNKL